MNTRKQGQIRIIGGRWRRRTLTVPDALALRPTHARIRETLFNWLMNDIVGATCLDVFAGSGALSFEALSRGAKKAVMIDSDSSVVDNLKQQARLFEAEGATCLCADFALLSSSKLSGTPFNIVFLDPPYHQNLLPVAVDWLIKNALIAPGTLVYVETEKDAQLTLPNNWRLLKQGKTKRISYALWQVES